MRSPIAAVEIATQSMSGLKGRPVDHKNQEDGVQKHTKVDIENIAMPVASSPWARGSGA